MPFFPVSYRATPAGPFRPPISLRRSVAHLPVRRRPSLTPSVLPILQPPKFLRQSDFIYEDNEPKDEIYNYLGFMHHDHGTKIAPQITIRVPQFIPQQNYPKQPLSRIFTQHMRHAEPKYSLRFILNR
jgi:hypothetical protein